MPTPQPLPPIVGATENALGALLGHVLRASPIGGRTVWLYLNLTQSGIPLSQIAARLDLSIESVESVRNQLQRSGLLDASGALTDVGESHLSAAHLSVGTATAQLTAGIDEADLDTTVRVLDTMRQRAHAMVIQD